MPKAAPYACGLCGGVHAAGVSCSIALARSKERKARADAKRPSARARGYNAEWDAARAQYLLAYPSCRRCGAPASLVDHIKPHRGDQTLFWDRKNWQPLCTPCHSSHKQRLERKGDPK